MRDVQRIRISEIEPWRCACAKAAQRYAAMLRSGHQLPPILVTRQRGKYRYQISDGMHRTRAAKLAGRKTVEAIVIVESW
jgi:uncharacterized ParB-like nuclease family protein